MADAADAPAVSTAAETTVRAGRATTGGAEADTAAAAPGALGASDADLLLAFVADRDVACPRCEYNLRQLSAARCPECGDALVLRVGSAEPGLGAYPAILVAFAAGLGGALFFAALLLVYADSWWWRDHATPAVLLLAQAGLTAGGLAAARRGRRGRRRIRRASPAAQRRLAIAAWLLVIVLSTLTVAFFRDG